MNKIKKKKKLQKYDKNCEVFVKFRVASIISSIKGINPLARDSHKINEFDMGKS